MSKLRATIHPISLKGIYIFYVETSEQTDISVLVNKYETERGTFGFEYIKANKQYLVIKDFISKNPQLKLKYRTWIDLEIKKRHYTIKWLHHTLSVLGYPYRYNTVARWVAGRLVPQQPTVKLLEQVFLRY